MLFNMIFLFRIAQRKIIRKSIKQTKTRVYLYDLRIISQAEEVSERTIKILNEGW